VRVTLDQTAPVSYRRVAVLYVCVVVMTLCLTWAFLGMRQVMAIGGSCASGGPYVSAQPCPDGAALLSIAIPLMIAAVFLGSAIAATLSAPTLLLPMWWLLFGSLGWNFLEYGLFDGSVDPGLVVCGVVFELMALPALLFQLPWGSRGPTKLSPPSSSLWWWPAYVLLGAVGLVIGVVTFDATG
jgi:hypothetical protein